MLKDCYPNAIALLLALKVSTNACDSNTVDILTQNKLTNALTLTFKYNN